MKKLVLISLACCTPLALHAAEITPPDMEVGHWVTTTDQTAMIDKMLESMPESARASVRKMMEEKMESVKKMDQCITQENLDSFDEQIKETFNQQGNCEFDVKESTKRKFVAEATCSGSVINITTNVINSKRNESTVVTNIPGMGKQKITSFSEWQSSVCPAGI